MNASTLARQSRRQLGTTMIETTAALALVGFATLAAATLLGTQPRCLERLETQQELLRVVEASLESVRAGAVELREGRIEPPIRVKRGVRLELSARPLEPSGLWEVSASASTLVRGRNLERRLKTIVWRPS